MCPSAAPSTCSGPDLWAVTQQMPPASLYSDRLFPAGGALFLHVGQSPSTFPSCRSRPPASPLCGEAVFPMARGAPLGGKDGLSSLLGVSVSAGGWGCWTPEEASAGVQNQPAHQPSPSSVLWSGGSRASQGFLRAWRRFLCQPPGSQPLSPQGTPVAGSQAAQLWAKCCHSK